MTVGLGIWLEATSDYGVPPDCYAAVRQGKAMGPVPPTYCVPYKVSCLGCVDKGGGPAVVDIFQRVGSVTLGSVEPGAQVDTTLDWPGCSKVRMRIAAVPVGEITEVPVLPHVVTSFLELQHEKVQELASEQSLQAELRLLSSEMKEPEVQGDESESDENEERENEDNENEGRDNEEREREENETEINATPIPVDIPAAPQALTPESKEGDSSKTITLTDCNQILPNLYLGSAKAVEDTQRLVEQGVCAVCCCLRELEHPSSDWCSQLSYYRVDVEDMGPEPIELYFAEATNFIHSWVSRDQPLLVHCRAGVSRSASVVIAYLMTHRNYTLHDAFCLVKNQRDVITPNLGFMEKLIDYEEAVQGHPPTIDMLKYECWYTSSDRVVVPDLKPDR